MRSLVLALSLLALGAGTAPASAAPCKDARGKFVKCPPVKSARCRLNGKFASCATRGAKPM